MKAKRFMRVTNAIRRMAAGMVFGLVVLLAGSAQANPWYVDVVNGKNTNLGTSQGQAFSNITYALGKISQNDTIYVAPGTYTETPVVNTNCSIIATNGPLVTVVQANANYGVSSAGRVFTISPSITNVTLSGMTIRNGYLNTAQSAGAGIGDGTASAGGDPYLVSTANFTLTVTNCVVCSNQIANASLAYGGGISVGCPAGSSIGLGTVVIVDSTIISNLMSSGRGGAGIQVCASNITIQNCTVAYNSCTNLNGSGRQGGGGLSLNTFYTGTVYQCTIVGNTLVNPASQTVGYGGGIGVMKGNGWPSTFQGLSIRNCTIYGNSCTNEGGGCYMEALGSSGSLLLES